MGELEIRDALPADLQNLLKLYLHLNPDDLPCPREEALDIFGRLRLYPGSRILLGLVGSEAVASCTLIVIPNLTRRGKPYALVENVVTHADWRKRGFGTALLAVAAERAWIEGCYKVMLMTGSDDPETLAFYANAGFEQSKTGFQMRSHPAHER